MNSEWLIPDPSLPVRQGDLLISKEPKSQQIDEMCLVLTADCDISKGKFGKQLACLRVLNLDSYIRTIWADAKLQKTKLIEAQKLRDQVAKWHTKMLSTPSELTTTGALTWLTREEPERLCESLFVPLEERKKFIAVLQRARKAFSLLDGYDIANAISTYADFRAAVKSQEIDACRQEILQQVQGGDWPEDVFLLSSLPQIPSNGAIILLREIVGIPNEAVCFRVTDAVTSEMFLRVGRLQPTFKYAITQAFGSLYSRIGLPDDYEIRCKEAIESIKEIRWG